MTLQTTFLIPLLFQLSSVMNKKSPLDKEKMKNERVVVMIWKKIDRSTVNKEIDVISCTNSRNLGRELRLVTDDKRI